MLIANKTEQSILKLNHPRSNLADEKLEKTENFSDLLQSTIESNNNFENLTNSFTRPVTNLKLTEGIPAWVDLDYGYDPKNPRKPNMREMLENISGKSVEELYAGEKSTWKNLTSSASDILYGVVGNKEDTRDWNNIMMSKDIIVEARKETRIMHKPTINIASEINTGEGIISQYAVIKDASGNNLRTLTGNIDFIKSSLQNFGLTGKDVPPNIENLIDEKKFDTSVLKLLTNLSYEQRLEADAVETLAAAGVKPNIL